MTETTKKHRAGFVNIIGNPNVGKSTLMNALVGEKLSIVTAKAQTTRHRIMGIVNGDDYQIVYSDTPGILKPNYRLQQSMMNFVETAIGDADIILYVTDTVEKGNKNEEYIATIGRNPPAARPAAKVTACCSAIPTSKNLSGYTFLNLFRPVPSGIAAVMATTSGFLLASLIITVENTSV